MVLVPLNDRFHSTVSWRINSMSGAWCLCWEPLVLFDETDTAGASCVISGCADKNCCNDTLALLKGKGNGNGGVILMNKYLLRRAYKKPGEDNQRFIL